jgi:phosphatidylserine decarboxylase
VSSAYPHPLIAREGWPFVAIAVVAAIALSYAQWWVPAALAWICALFIVQFFRDPSNRSDAGQHRDFAGGRQDRPRRQARDPFLERDALKISVFMNVFNVHWNRSPVDGTVKNKWYHAGSFFNARSTRHRWRTNATPLHISTAAGVDVTCVRWPG